MHVLVTNITLATRTGTETFVRDLAVGLARRGHRVSVFSPEQGPLAREIERAGIEVVDSLRGLRGAPDVVHGHHHAPAVEALLAFPSSRALFVCHDRLSSTDVPPLHPRVLRYVAVDANCEERLRAYSIPEERCSRVPNAVDLARYLPRGPLPARPVRALVFSNNAETLFDVDPIRRACAARGIALDVAGEGSGGSWADPSHVLPGYDIVFAKARCALEALAVGCAVVLCDFRGFGEMVTRGDAERMRAWNFGMRLLGRAITVEALLAEIDRYDPVDAAAVRDWARREADLGHALDRYEELYREIVEEPVLPLDPGEELRLYLGRQVAAGLDVADRPADCVTAPLTDDALAAIELSWAECPSRVRAGERFLARVTLTNRSTSTVASDPPWPIHLSYHWLHSASGEVAVWDGRRSRVSPALRADQTGTYRVDVEAPERSGPFRLRAALVQESVAWLDARFPHLGIDADVEVEIGAQGSS